MQVRYQAALHPELLFIINYCILSKLYTFLLLHKPLGNMPRFSQSRLPFFQGFEPTTLPQLLRDTLPGCATPRTVVNYQYMVYMSNLNLLNAWRTFSAFFKSRNPLQGFEPTTPTRLRYTPKID